MCLQYHVYKITNLKFHPGKKTGVYYRVDSCYLDICNDICAVVIHVNLSNRDGMMSYQS